VSRRHRRGQLVRTLLKPHRYGTILATAAAFLLLIALQSVHSFAAAAVLAAAVVVLTPVFMLRTWLHRRSLTPEQRQTERDAAAAEHARDAALARQKRDIPGALLSIAFLVLELAILILALALGVTWLPSLFASPLDDPNGWGGALGGALAVAAALFLVWPLDRLAKRLTGLSPLAALGDIGSSF